MEHSGSTSSNNFISSNSISDPIILDEAAKELADVPYRSNKKPRPNHIVKLDVEIDNSGKKAVIYSNQLESLKLEKTRLLSNTNANYGAIAIDSPEIKYIPRSRFTYFVKGFNFIFNGLWPATFLGLFAHDVIVHYTNPLDRYGNTFGDILIGRATNEDSLTSQLRHGLFDDYYWSGIAILLGTPLLTGITYAIARPWSWHPLELQTDEVVNQLNTFPRNIYWDLATLSPWSPLRGALLHTEFLLTYESPDIKSRKENINKLNYELEQDVQNVVDQTAIEQKREQRDQLKKDLEHLEILEIKQKQNLLIALVTLTQDYRFFTRYYALRTLANIVEKTGKANIHLEPQAAAFHELVSRMLMYKVALDDKRLLADENLIEAEQLEQKDLSASGGLFSYPAWKVGKHTSRWSNLFYVPLVFTRYSQAFLLALVCYEIYDSILYLVRRDACLKNNGYYGWWEETAQHACTPCNWPPYIKALNSQGCLESAIAQSSTAKQLENYLVQFKGTQTVTQLNFSGVDWAKWEYADFDAVLTRLESILPTEINTVDLSLDEQIENTPAINHIERLGRFLNKIFTKAVYLGNQNLGADNIKIIIHSIGNTTHTLDLANNNIEEGVITIGQMLPRLAIQTIILDGNEIDGNGFKVLADSLAQNTSTVISISLKNNKADETSLSYFFSKLSQTTIEAIYLDDNHLPQNAIKALGNALPTSAVKKISVNNCAIENSDMVHFAPGIKQLNQLVIGHNPYTDRGTGILFNNLINSSVSLIDIDQIAVSEKGLEQCLSLLPKTSIQTIKLPGKALNQNNIRKFIGLLPQTNITEIMITNTNLGDFFASELNSALKNRQKIFLKKLILNKTRLTSAGAKQILEYLPNTQLDYIDFSGNLIDGNITLALASVLPENPQLKNLILDNNQIDERIIQVINVLTKTQLTLFSAKNNPLGNQAGIKMAQALITPIPQIEQLAENNLSRDVKHFIADTARAETELMQVVLDSTGLNDVAQRALCRVNVAIPSVIISTANNSNITKVDPVTCREKTNTETGIGFFQSSTYPNRIDKINEQAAGYFTVHQPGFFHTQNRLPGGQQNSSVSANTFLMGALASGGIVLIVLLLVLMFKGGQKIYQNWNPKSDEDKKLKLVI